MTQGKKSKENLSLEDLLSKVEKIDGWLWQNEIVTLFTYASLAAKNLQKGELLIEIGSWQGRSSLTIGFACRMYRKGILYSIDPYETIFSRKRAGKSTLTSFSAARVAFRKNIARYKLQAYIKPIKLSSQKAFEQYKDVRTRFIFMDGDHSYEGAHFDAHNWSKTLVDDGYLLMHDTLDIEGPRKVQRQFLLHPHFAYIGTIGNVSCFQKKSLLSLRDWLKKIYGYTVFSLLFKIYTPNLS